MAACRRLVTVGALSVIAVVIAAGPASAHATLLSTKPLQGSVLTASPPRVVLQLDQPVETDLGSVRVFGPAERRVDEGGTYRPNGNSSVVAVNLAAHLPDGTYIVAWRVISADSHPVHGAFIFSVGTAAGIARATKLANTLADQSGSTLVGVAYWAIRVAAFAGLLLLVGVGTMVSSVWPLGAGTRRIRRILWWSWASLLAATVFGIAIQGVYATALPIGDLAKPSLISAVLHTRFGELELLRLALLILVVPVVLGLIGRAGRAARVGGWSWWLPAGALIGIALLATPGLAGHAATGSAVALGIPVDLLHLLFISVWLGGLIVLAASLLPGLHPPEREDDLQAIALRVSTFAFIAVCGVIATGVIQAIRTVGSWSALFGTPYGRILLVKIALVTVMVALGAVSRRLVHGRLLAPVRRPRLVMPTREAALASVGALSATDLALLPSATDPVPSSAVAVSVADRAPASEEGPVDDATSTRPSQLGRIRRSVLAELGMALVVLGVTGALVNAAPARQVRAEPFTGTWNVLGVQVNAVVAPAVTGPGNQFHFYVLGPNGGPVAIPELDAAISLSSQGIGPISIPLVVAGPGHYAARGVELPIAGSWQLVITVRTTAIDERLIYTTLPVR